MTQKGQQLRADQRRITLIIIAVFVVLLLIQTAVIFRLRGNAPFQFTEYTRGEQIVCVGHSLAYDYEFRITVVPSSFSVFWELSGTEGSVIPPLLVQSDIKLDSASVSVTRDAGILAPGRYTLTNFAVMFYGTQTSRAVDGEAVQSRIYSDSFSVPFTIVDCDDTGAPIPTPTVEFVAPVEYPTIDELFQLKKR